MLVWHTQSYGDTEYFPKSCSCVFTLCVHLSRPQCLQLLTRLAWTQESHWKYMDGWKNRWIGGWMNRCMGGWICKWMDGWQKQLPGIHLVKGLGLPEYLSRRNCSGCHLSSSLFSLSAARLVHLLRQISGNFLQKVNNAMIRKRL